MHGRESFGQRFRGLIGSRGSLVTRFFAGASFAIEELMTPTGLRKANGVSDFGCRLMELKVLSEKNDPWRPSFSITGATGGTRGTILRPVLALDLLLISEKRESD